MRALKTSLAVIVILTAAVAAFAQAAVTAADLNRLDATATEIQQMAANIKKTDPTLGADIEKSLATLREDVTYLKVRLRRESAVPRADYTDVRDRLETLRVKASGQKVTGQPVMQADPVTPVERVWTVPVGTEMDVRLQTALNSATARVEQRFEATTLVDLKMGGQVVIPEGTTVRGFVGSVRAAGRIDRKGSLTLAFDEIKLPNGPVRLRATVTQALDPKTADDVRKVGAGAVVGAIVGGILGGGKGALLGVLVGGGTTVATTDGANVDLPIGTVLRLRLDQPLEIR